MKITFFHPIPGYGNYCIDTAGRVYSRLSDGLLSGGVNPSGYVNYRLKSDLGYTLTWGRHRLMGFVFMHPGRDISNLVINHLNGVPGDDRLDNFEWCTDQQNMEHAGAMGLTSKCNPVECRDIDTGEISTYPSATACALHRRLTKNAVLYRLRCGEYRVFPERCQYRLACDREWVRPADVEIQLSSFGRKRPVAVLFQLTKTIMLFDGMTEAANYLKVSVPTIQAWLDKTDQPTLPGFIQMKLLHDGIGWRNVDDPMIDYEKCSSSRPVAIFDSNGTWMFSSAKEAASWLGVKYTTLFERLRVGRNNRFGNFTVLYYSDTVGPLRERLRSECSLNAGTSLEPDGTNHSQ